MEAAQADSDTAVRILEFDLVTLRRAPKNTLSGIGGAMQIQSVGKLTQPKLSPAKLTSDSRSYITFKRLPDLNAVSCFPTGIDEGQPMSA